MRNSKLLKSSLILLPFSLFATEGVIKHRHKTEHYTPSQENSGRSECSTDINSNLSQCTYDPNTKSSASAQAQATAQVATAIDSAHSSYSDESADDLLNDLDAQIDSINNNPDLSQEEKDSSIADLVSAKENIVKCKGNTICTASGPQTGTPPDSAPGTPPGSSGILQNTTFNTSTGDQGFISENGEYGFYVQADGNLVIYEVSFNSETNEYVRVAPIAATGTHGQTNPRVSFQGGDGNLVVYKNNSSNPADAVYATGITGVENTYMVISDNGHLVQKNESGNQIWSSESDSNWNYS